MSRSKVLPDIKVRLALFARKLQIESAKGWLDIMGYDNVSSVSRINTLQSPISERAVAGICKAADLETSCFTLPPNELGLKLGLPSNVIHDIIRENTELESRNDIQGVDKQIIGDIAGNFAMVYLGIDVLTPEYKYVVVERLIFDNPDLAEASMRVHQIDNYVNGETPYGILTSRSGRINIRLQYKLSQYPESCLMLIPHYTKNQGFLSGLYMDVTAAPKMRVFCTRVVVFGIDDTITLPRRFEQTSEAYDRWKHVLENQIPDGSRLYAPVGEEYIDQMVLAINFTKSDMSSR